MATRVFLQPMELLIRSLQEEADLNPLGRFMNRTNILRLLKHRLYVQDLVKRHPEILERTIPDPVVVVGLARSGTTRLHRLLAADQRFLHLKAWETVYPVPYPECFQARDAGAADPRIKALDRGLKAVLYMSPQIAAVHPLGTFEVEEEVGLIQHGFSSQLFEIQAKIPSFAEWLDDTRPDRRLRVYGRTAQDHFLVPRRSPGQALGTENAAAYAGPGRAAARFSQGKLICSHRDPVKAVGSACSMTWNAIVRDSDTVTADWVGQEWLNKTERMLRKTLRVREEIAPGQNQYDIQYADISADWERAMRGVYDFLAMPFTDGTRDGHADLAEGQPAAPARGAPIRLGRFRPGQGRGRPTTDVLPRTIQHPVRNRLIHTRRRTNNPSRSHHEY